MKKIYLLTLSVWLCTGLLAAPRSLQQARMAASGMRHVHTACKADGQPAFYVFNKGNEEGFVIISAEDRAYTVLGYSDRGHWDESNLPDNMRVWLDGYVKELSYVASLPEMPEQESRSRRTEADKTYIPVAPMCQTQWGQSAPYNDLCPLANGKRCITGCVATAAAQVMKVYNHPLNGIGSNAYKWGTPNGDSILLSADFGNTTYQWSNMINSYTNTGTTEQKNAVAMLMYHCGVACNMNYNTSASGANISVMINGMINHFGYDKGVRPLFRDYLDDETLLDSVYADLRRNHPVLVSAKTISNSGHAFICDGIDADGLLHINWGWYGMSDGYFRLSAFDPKNQGEGGSTSGKAYTEQIQFFTNIKPDANGEYCQILTCENITTNKKRYGKSEQLQFGVDTLRNRGLASWAGDLAVWVYQNGTLVTRKTVDDSRLSLNSGYYYTRAIPLNVRFNDLTAGEYEVVMTARNEQLADTYIPLLRRWLGEWRCQMTVTEDSIWLEYPEITVPESSYSFDPSAYTFTRLSAYYYPTSSTDTRHSWKLQLATSDFYSETGGDDEMLLLFKVYGAYPDAIAGSFPDDSSLPYYCLSGGQYIGAASQDKITLQKPECSLVYNTESDSYLFHYHFRVGGKDYSGSATIPSGKVHVYYGEEYDGHSKQDRIEPEHTAHTSLTTTQAVQLIKQHEADWRSAIPYVVSGTVSSINNTPAEIVQYQNCRLYLSDGTTPIYSFSTRWLNDAGYETGNELQVGGKGAVAGKLCYYQGTTPEIEKGFFCQYDPYNAVETLEQEVTRAQKIWRNGVLYIRRDGVEYTAQGMKIKE